MVRRASPEEYFKRRYIPVENKPEYVPMETPQENWTPIIIFTTSVCFFGLIIAFFAYLARGRG